MITVYWGCLVKTCITAERLLVKFKVDAHSKIVKSAPHVKILTTASKKILNLGLKKRS